MESFNSITRDINSVRERALNTQGSRRQRKENKKKEAAAADAHKATIVKREGGSSDEATGQNDIASVQRQQLQQAVRSPFPSSFWNPAPRPRPRPQTVLERTQRNWGFSNGTQNANDDEDESENPTATAVEPRSEMTAMDVDDAAARTSDEDEPLRNAFSQGHPSGGVFPLAPIFPPRSSSLRQNPVSRSPPNPFLLSPTPENDNIETARTESQAEKQRREQLDERERKLREGETRLATQQYVLSNREEDLKRLCSAQKSRETELDKREERLRQREVAAKNDTQLDAVRKRQLEELEVMLARHRDEMNR